jgi:HAMP domain-containing protein
MGSESIEALRARLERLSQEIEDARSRVHGWTDANAKLSLNAQEARAKNQARGNTGWSVLLGAKYRAAERRIAATSNAHIAQEVAEKRIAIAENKRGAQEEVRSLQASIAELKKQLKRADAEARRVEAPRLQAPQISDIDVKTATAILDLMLRLKAAHEAGVLNTQEYEEKRLKLLGRL